MAEWEEGLETTNAEFLRFPGEKRSGNYRVQFKGEPYPVNKTFDGKTEKQFEVKVIDLDDPTNEDGFTKEKVMPLASARLRARLKAWRESKMQKGLDGLKVEISWEGRGFDREYLVGEIAKEDLVKLAKGAVNGP